MSATGRGPGISAADVYKGFIDAVNRQDLEAATQFVDAARYRENCVGFTHGFVDWQQAQKSVRQVWKGLPDLRVELDQVLASSDVALAHGTVRGTATGRLYWARHAWARSCSPAMPSLMARLCSRMAIRLETMMTESSV